MARRKSTPRKRKGRRTKVSRKRARPGPSRPVASKKRRITPVSHSAKSVHKIRNPFSKLTDVAKIPDDSVSHSLARTLQHVSQIRNAADVGTMHILLHPSMGIGCSVFGDVDAYGDRTVSYLGFPDQQLHINAYEAALAGGGEGVELKNGSEIAKWRIVSQGLRLSLNNVAEENDGWYETCRIIDDKDIKANWCIAPVDNKPSNITQYEQCGLGGTDAIGGMVTVLDGLSLIEQPGYQTGLLKDLGKKEFKLNPVGNAMDFQEMYDSYQLTEGSQADFFHNTDKGVIQLQSNNAKTKNVFDSMQDHNHDMVYIRVHPRANTGGKNAGSAMIAHLVQNIEFCLGPTSQFVAFQTPSPGMAGIGKIIGGINDKAEAERGRKA